MTTNSINFIRRGDVVTLPNVSPTRTLLQVLREDLNCTSVKEGCNEGDCGACTVVLGEAVDGRVNFRAVNSCIRLRFSRTSQREEQVSLESFDFDQLLSTQMPL